MAFTINVIFAATVAVIAMSLTTSGADEVDEVVPEVALFQAETRVKTLGFLSMEEETTCEINVRRCFSSSQYPAPDACQEAVTKCDALENHASGKIVERCRKDAESKCVWTKATKGFVASYQTLCGGEIKVKATVNEGKQKRQKRTVESKSKSEKIAKGAAEALTKCKARELRNKKGFEQQSKQLEKQVKNAEKQEAKLSSIKRTTVIKVRAAADKQETELFGKEQTTKERGYKTVKETSNKAEMTSKSLREQLYKKQKISKAMQEGIYKDWNKKAEFEMRAKTTEKAHKKPKTVMKPKTVDKAAPQRMTYVAEKEPVAPVGTADCLCSFPFVYNGKSHFDCVSEGSKSFCLDGNKKMQDCKPSCQAVWEVHDKTSPPSPPQSTQHTRPKKLSPVPPLASAPTLPNPAKPIHELRLKEEEKKVKKFKEVLTKASEKSEKAKSDTLEKKKKCEIKLKDAQKRLEAKNKSELNSKKEIYAKKEKTNKLESGEKEKRLKEKMSKEATSKQESKHAVSVANVKKESASKVEAFKANESSAKKATKEKQEKHPLAGLKSYCSKLHKLKADFAKTKESDTKKIKEMQKKNTVQYKMMTKHNEQSVKSLHAQQCHQTKEVCNKIHQTSERREKHAASVANERKSKLKAKCALSAKYQAAEAGSMKFAICAAAHKEVMQILRSIEHQQGDIIESTKSQQSHLLTKEIDQRTYSVLDSEVRSEMKTEIGPQS